MNNMIPYTLISPVRGKTYRSVIDDINSGLLPSVVGLVGELDSGESVLVSVSIPRVESGI